MDPWTKGPCQLCGGAIGPDLTDRPTCYRCGPEEMLPHHVASDLLARVAELEKALRATEWADGGDTGGGECFFCAAGSPPNHKPGCIMATLPPEAKP